MAFNLNELAKLLGVTPRRVQQLVDAGVVVRSGRGKYEGSLSVQNYIQYQLDQMSHSNDKADYFDERALHERAKREKAELELAMLKGELHHANDVRTVMGDMLVAFRSKILAMPSKLAPQLVGQTDIPAVMDIIAKETHEALSELSEYNPADFQISQADADEEEQ